jgi:hypothetical protein
MAPEVGLGGCQPHPGGVAQQSEQRRRRCFPVRSASGGAK